MNEDLIEEFEEETGIYVVYNTVGSNEVMESSIKNRKYHYDIVIPSEYMVDKLRQQGLIQEIDFSRLENYNKLTVFSEAQSLISETGFQNYFVPYVWGTVGIMYNTKVQGLKEALENDPWGVVFNPDSPYKIGMYDSPRDAIASALLALGKDINSANDKDLEEAERLLKNANIEAWGEDALKNRVSLGNLDLAVVYSGDYFDELFNYEEAELDINFDYIAPNNTNIWIDAMVIPTKSENVDNAYKFIDFMLKQENAVSNNDAIGYPSMFVEVYNILVSEEYGYINDDRYFPFPTGTTRQIYKYVSNEHFAKLNAILERVKVN